MFDLDQVDQFHDQYVDTMVTAAIFATGPTGRRTVLWRRHDSLQWMEPGRRRDGGLRLPPRDSIHRSRRPRPSGRSGQDRLVSPSSSTVGHPSCRSPRRSPRPRLSAGPTICRSRPGRLDGRPSPSRGPSWDQLNNRRLVRLIAEHPSTSAAAPAVPEASVRTSTDPLDLHRVNAASAWISTRGSTRCADLGSTTYSLAPARRGSAGRRGPSGTSLGSASRSRTRLGHGRGRRVRLAGELARLGGLAVLNLEGVQTRYEDADAVLPAHRHRVR